MTFVLVVMLASFTFGSLVLGCFAYQAFGLTPKERSDVVGYSILGCLFGLWLIGLVL